MVKDSSTGLKDRFKTKIFVGDLVTLNIPRTNRLEELVIFEVIEGRGDFALLAYADTLHPGHLKYRQELKYDYQVYKVIGNIKEGIKQKLLV